MISDARGGHVSPGIYTEERDVTYSVKSLGITSLGLVGETLYGPAFEKVSIENWAEFVDYFGGCSPEKFKNGLPKYELPYVAKEYLQESKRLTVVRVLGLSGYHAGPAFVISLDGKPIVILRSKMLYGQNSEDICNEAGDAPVQLVETVETVEYKSSVFDSVCRETGSEPTDIKNPYKFAIKVTCNANSAGFNTEYTYNLSLNPQDSDYIYNVLSDTADGTTPIYIEAVYENSFGSNSNMSSCKATTAYSAMTKWNRYAKVTESEAVYETDENGKETEKISGYTFTVKECSKNAIPQTAVPSYTSAFNDTQLEEGENGVEFYINGTENANTKYFFISGETSYAVYDDFLEEYRPAQTPWIVSDASVSMGKTSVATLRKLFKFITISDGEAANFQVKVSIQNIDPFNGTFDVVVRDFNDSDNAIVILERFSRCNLIEGDANYIAYKIGTSDGGYVSKSKYITVEMADGEDFSNNIPAGFLGYPMPSYKCASAFTMPYNTKFIPSIKSKRQYFGLSDIKGIDMDAFKYKGRMFYTNGDMGPEKLCNGFHMDSAFEDWKGDKVFVDGVSGYNFTTISSNKVGSEAYQPRLLNMPYLDSTIFRDKSLRKFTVCFYGGFDGWDVNRGERTNGDNYKSTRYNVNGSSVFSKVMENGLNLSLNLPNTAITTDYYAYLAGYRQFANPQDSDINLFATPGIDWYNNTLLTEDALDVIEDGEDGRGGDALYVMNSPADMDVDELASEFDGIEMSSSYACTYAPWAMYYDASNKRYINLPVTKDVVRNMAATDNNSYPWYAPAGIERGNVNCIKAAYKTTLADEDKLYEANINPIKTFAQDGVKVWGNKTAYRVESPLNRVNVRRLMIRVKKLVMDASRNLIFEQYDDTLEKQFRGLIDPILADVKSNRGIYDYRIMTECTEETRDQHILPAKILIKPTPALEYISISFVVYPESVQFEEN